MFPRTLRNSLQLFSFVITLVHCSSIDFFTGQAFDECSRNSETLACANNTDRGGLCAYAPDINKLWCCPAPNPTCWNYGQDCNGGSSTAPGPGQISCSKEGAQWCCNQEYEVCTQVKNAINVCETVFASENANVSIAEANAVESSSTSTTSSTTSTTSSTTSTTSSTTPLSSASRTLSSKANARSTSTTSATTPLDTDSSSLTTSSTVSSTPQPSASPGASKPSSALSPGAIAGIVIGVILAIALGFLICWCIIHTRRRPTHEAQPINKIMIPEMSDDAAKWELDGRRSAEEMPGHHGANSELDGRRSAGEMPGQHDANSELDGRRSAGEMPGHDMRHEMF